MVRFVTVSSLLIASLGACVGPSDSSDGLDTGEVNQEIDYIPNIRREAQLLVVDAAADWRAAAAAVEAIDGEVLQLLPPRLIVARIPAGSGEVLADAGVLATFDRAVTADDLPSASTAELRFAAVYSNRHHPSDIEPLARIVAKKLVLAEDEPFETSPGVAGGEGGPGGPNGPGGTDPEAEALVSVPYAAGTVVVSVILPESNGVYEPSTEDWTEELIQETYHKIQAALDHIASLEPNAGLRFVMHYESHPANGGLEGTVDHDYEFGKHANWGGGGLGESFVTAALFQTILGRPVTIDTLWQEEQAYITNLKAQYNADAAFLIKVAGNGNYTAGLRAHAYIGGPETTLDSSYGYEVFMHEFGHIFGALDEYCPDACVPPTALHGYLGIYNANAHYQVGGPGIDNGRGESAPSIMAWNTAGSVDGYARAAWGWLDTDGDGVLEVRDTRPLVDLAATVEGSSVRLTGQIVDQPEVRPWGTRYSVNRITALEYRVASASTPWLRVALPASQRGRELVDLVLGALPAGEHQLEVRGVNSAGNTGPARSFDLTVEAAADGAPHLALDADPAVASTAADVTLVATAFDLDAPGADVSVRFDVDGDGAFDTAWSTDGAVTFRPLVAGSFTVVAEARDAAGHVTTATAPLHVLAGGAPPRIALSGPPSIVHAGGTIGGGALGAAAIDAVFAADVTDPEGEAVELNWIARLATDDVWQYGDYRVETGYGAAAEQAFLLEAPLSLRSEPVDLTAGDPEIGWAQPEHVISLGNRVVAVAAGAKGVWFVDVNNPAAPVIVRRVATQTNARRLLRQGNRLYVLGTMLSVIDISSLGNATEIEPLFPVEQTRIASPVEVTPLVEGDLGGSWASTYAEWGQRIDQLKISVTIDHQRPADLTITLVPPKQLGVGPIVLRDHQPGPAGLRTYKFHQGNTPALAALQGALAMEYWQINVTDDKVNGKVGAVVSTELKFLTETYATQVHDGASELVGVKNGYLIVAGRGVEILDAWFAEWMYQVARIDGTGTIAAKLIGSTVYLLAPLKSKAPEGETVVEPPLRGLAAIDVSIGWWPWIRRVEPLAAAEMAVLDNRMYLRIVPERDCGEEGCEKGPGGGEPPADPYTLVGSVASFRSGATGSTAWQLGQTATRVDRDAFLEGGILWGNGDQGGIQKVDHGADPIALPILATYARDTGAPLLRLAPSVALLMNWSTMTSIVHLDEVVSTVSRVYEVTAEARDAAGNVSRVTRHVHVVPYDRAPNAPTINVVAGVTSADLWTFEITATDPDEAQTWDPNRFYRADWNNDGNWDSDWAITYTGWPTAQLQTQFPAPGTYTVRFEARDGFWAAASVQTITVTVL